MGRYLVKDYAIYWECEEYFKVWGYGLKENFLFLNFVFREKGFMRDRIWFKEVTIIFRLLKLLDFVFNK